MDNQEKNNEPNEKVTQNEEVTPKETKKKGTIADFFKKLSKKQLIAIISAVVAVAVLVPVIILLPKNNNNTPTHQTPPPSGDTNTTPGGSVETTTPDPGDDLLPEKVNLGGYSYKAFVRSENKTTGDTMEDGNPSFYCEDFWIDSKGGEPEDALSYAVYMRNKEIESAYNAKIIQVKHTINMVQELGRFYQNSEKFDLTIILAKSAATAATQNLLTDLNHLSGLDLTHKAYDQNSIKELSMANKLYYLSGDMNISTLDSVAPTVVNLERYENYAEGIVESFDGDPLYADIYNLVTSGKWTMDTMLTIAELASSDADTSDGVLGSSEQDNVGYFQYAESAIYYFYGSGGRLTQMTEEGSPEFVVQSQKNQELYNYIYDKFHPNVRNVKYPYGYSGPRKTNFITNANTLFTDMTLWDIRKDLYLNGTFEYGLLPTPVYEENDSYSSVVYFYNVVHLWAIPALCNDSEKAQIMMNVMAAYSSIDRVGSTMDGYYTRTLYFTVAPNDQARKVMNIIKDSTVYDIALLYDWGGWRTNLSQLWYKLLPNNYGSLVQQMNAANGAVAQLEETIELFRYPGSIPD